VKEQTLQTLREDRNILRSDSSVLHAVKQNYPVKTAVYLSQLTGAPIRTCEYWLSTDWLPSEAVWALLKSEDGIQYLAAGMEDARPEWWKRLLRLGIAASAMRRRAADQRLIEQTLEADRDLNQAIARATALSVQDEEFHRPFADALNSFLGVPDRALAQSKKR
jgi:hypothetical protein